MTLFNQSKGVNGAPGPAFTENSGTQFNNNNEKIATKKQQKCQTRFEGKANRFTKTQTFFTARSEMLTQCAQLTFTNLDLPTR